MSFTPGPRGPIDPRLAALMQMQQQRGPVRPPPPRRRRPLPGPQGGAVNPAIAALAARLAQR